MHNQPMIFMVVGLLIGTIILVCSFAFGWFGIGEEPNVDEPPVIEDVPNIEDEEDIPSITPTPEANNGSDTEGNTPNEDEPPITSDNIDIDVENETIPPKNPEASAEVDDVIYGTKENGGNE